MVKTPNLTDYEAERRRFHLDVPAQFNNGLPFQGINMKQIRRYQASPETTRGHIIFLPASVFRL